MSTFSLAGEALGITYDEVYLVQLKHPDATRKMAVIFDAAGKPTSMVAGAYKIRGDEHRHIDALFSPKADFDNGKADSRLMLYSLVFYKGGKAVLTISPNLTGGDLYASDKVGYDPRSLSPKQREAFTNIVYDCLAGWKDSVDLPNRNS